MTTIILNNGENETNLKALLDRIDNLQPEMDLYSALVDEKILAIEV